MRRSLMLALVLISALAAGAGASAEEKKKGGGESFLQFPGMVATMNANGARRGVLSVEMGLDVPDGGLRERAASLQPRLRDSYLRYLMTYAAGLPPGAPPNPDAISVALQRATDATLGRPGAKLLLGSILEN
jgi:hypothetical protein